MRILVTGGTGFIGREVVAEAVRRGHEVTALSLRGTDPAPTGVRLVRHDLRDASGPSAWLEGVDAVVHCAAAMSGDLSAQRAITVEGTRHLIQAMASSGVRRLVLVSSFAVYDCQAMDVGAVLDESAPLATPGARRAPYITAKLEQEALVRELPVGEGWRWTVLRPGLVHGPGRRWFHHLGIQLSPSRWIALAGSGRLPLCHVTSCAAASVLAAEVADAAGETLNLVDSELPTRRDYMESLADRTVPRPAISNLPWGLLDRAARTADALNRLVTGGRGSLPGLLDPPALAARCKPLEYSNARARRVLGWVPCRGMAADRDPDRAIGRPG